MPFHVIEGYQKLREFASDFKGGKLVVYFRGAKVDGSNWCPDCRKCDENVETTLKDLGDSNIETVVCDVGQREYWKDNTNPFKTELKLNGIPTLYDWKTGEKITDENELAKKDVVVKFCK